ncbi:MAG: class IV adenylate cyclase [Pirellulales bacterium]
MRNIELKARLADLPAARRVALQLAAEPRGILRQTDTYFHCRHGRLKLRETAGQPAQLVAYSRPDQPDSRGSDYQLVAVADPAALKAALAESLGVRGIVLKSRELYLLDNVRLHLDEVTGLGTFLEFEAVLGDGQYDTAGHAQLARLSQAFGLRSQDLLSNSYSDLAGLDP